jgi:hypothetical protein
LDTTSDSDDENSDTTVGPFNRQWDPGRTDEAQARTRFFARVYPVSGHLLVLALDSSDARKTGGLSPPPYGVADSLLVAYRPGENFSYLCNLGGSNATFRVGGLSGSENPEVWRHPRLAWEFDTVAKRIRSLPHGIRHLCFERT